MKSTYSQNSLRNPHALYMLSQLDYTSFMEVIPKFNRLHKKEIAIDLWAITEQEKIDRIVIGPSIKKYKLKALWEKPT